MELIRFHKVEANDKQISVQLTRISHIQIKTWAWYLSTAINVDNYTNKNKIQIAPIMCIVCLIKKKPVHSSINLCLMCYIAECFLY